MIKSFISSTSVSDCLLTLQCPWSKVTHTHKVVNYKSCCVVPDNQSVKNKGPPSELTGLNRMNSLIFLFNNVPALTWWVFLISSPPALKPEALTTSWEPSQPMRGKVSYWFCLCQLKQGNNWTLSPRDVHLNLSKCLSYRYGVVPGDNCPPVCRNCNRCCHQNQALSELDQIQARLVDYY